MPISSEGGTYILLVELPSPISIEVGRLGAISFDAGVYAYVGSALGPGGLAARLGRYAAGPTGKHWHIDYLLEHAEVRGALVNTNGARLECSWSAWVEARTQTATAGFGSSDCHCTSHLYFVGDNEEGEEIIRAAGCELKASALSEVNNGL
jgi:Uri superfamily endonuclease